MPENWRDKMVVCPFFVRRGRQQIFCERMIPEARGGSLASTFTSETAKNEFMRRVCCSNEYATRCRIAEAHQRYWRGESDVETRRKK